MRLNEFQQQFRDLMLDHPDALTQVGGSFAGQFREGHIPLAERLRVYRNNIVGSVTDSLMATFPIIEKLVGHEFLETMARSYTLRNPPQSGNLNMYGDHFDRFIEDFKPAKALPYLPDVARLEIALNKAYYARDDRALSAEHLSQIPPDTLWDVALAGRTSLSLIDSKFPLLAIKEFCYSDTANSIPPDINSGGEKLAVFRPATEVRIISLGDEEFDMLRLLCEGQKLGQATETLMARYPQFDFGAFLSKHLALETFGAIDTNKYK